MAMEWTAQDVLRIMRDETTATGEVSLPAVKAHFNLNSPAKDRHFVACVERLVQNGNYSATSQMGGTLH